jgi:hypothetical protein
LGLTFTWQAKVNFNQSHIEATRVDYTGVGKSLFVGALGTIPVTPVIDNATGSVTHGESLIAGSVPASTNSLFWIEFQIVAVPGVGETFNDMISVEAPDANTFILDPDLVTISPNVGETSFEFEWTAPGPARLEVTPASQSFGYPPPTLVVGTTFTSDVVITSLSAGWFLGNATTHLAYNSTLLSVTSVTFDPIWNITSTAGSVPGDLYLEVKDPTSNPSGTVKIATVEFTILYQDFAPPRPFPPAPGSSDDTPLDLNTYALYSTANIPITTNPAVDGLVKIYVYQTLIPPHLSVSSTTIGPGPSIGQQFNVTVSINDLSEFLNMIGVQFRLTYPATLIEPVVEYEGPFLPYYASQQPGSLGTFFISFHEINGIYGPHVLVGNMILPNGTGVWHDPMPKGTGVIATITFKVIYQSFGDPDLSGPLQIVDQMAIGLDNIVDQNIVDVPMDPPDNGMYTITTNLPGRNIDLYGGAVNSGYGPLEGYYLQFPAPYGGQGPQAPMDLVEEQSWVWLHANVTYNYWPIQHKLVGFQVNYPVDGPYQGGLYSNFFAFTDENGVATIGFRMPWPCDNPESLFGVWHVIASVQVADVYLQDTMDYHYDYLVQIFKVTTDKYEYNHGETVEVCVTFGSHAQQDYPILLKVHIADELGVIFGHFEIATHVGGTVFCQYKNTTLCGGIWIPKWAYTGIATVHVNIFDQEPIFGGAPWTPEYTPPPTIAIQPY